MSNQLTFSHLHGEVSSSVIEVLEDMESHMNQILTKLENLTHRIYIMESEITDLKIAHVNVKDVLKHKRFRCSITEIDEL